MNNPEVRRSLEQSMRMLNNPELGLKDRPTREAAREIYEAAERNHSLRPCEERVTCKNGETAIIVIPRSHTVLTRRGVTVIFRRTQAEE